MGKFQRIYDRFEFWSAEDCSCLYCLYYPGKDRPCPRDVCCCEDIRQEALRREHGADSGSQGANEAMLCRV